MTCMIMLKKTYKGSSKTSLFLSSLSHTCPDHPLIMLLLFEFEVGVLEHVKAMPEVGKAEDINFEVWGQKFCEKMVSFILLMFLQ